jgi:glyoxylase-like metal-dependent hydrolase (beta-lactamase superfamily II)
MPASTVPAMINRSRRSFLVDLGAAGVGVVFLGACAGSSDGASEADVSDGTAPAPADADPSDDDVDTASSDVGLRLQHVSLGFVSAYVLVRGSEAAIVDTGGSDSRDAILEGLSALSVTGDMVRHVVLTHNHGDHIGGLSGLEADVTNATVHAGAADIGSIRTSLPLSELTDGDDVFGMGVIGTPGHTPGSISLFDVDSGILVAGDAIGGDGNGGLTGANPDFTPDMETATASVARLAELDVRLAAFGHGGPPVDADAMAKLAALV